MTVFTVPGAKLVRTTDEERPFYVDFDNVYLDKEVEVTQKMVGVFECAISNYANIAEPSKSFSDLARKHLLTHWDHAFHYIQDYMGLRTIRFAQEDCTRVLNRLINDDLPEFVRKHMKIQKKTVVAKKAASIVFSFRVERASLQYELTGLWDEEKNEFFPSPGPGEKGRVTAILSKNIQALTMEELVDNLQTLNNEFFFQNQKLRLSNALSAPLAYWYTKGQPGSMRYESLIKDGCDSMDLRIKLPEIKIGPKRIAVTYHELPHHFTDRRPEEDRYYHGVKMDSKGTWKSSRATDMKFAHDVEKITEDFLAFLEDPKSNVLFNALYNVWFREGDLTCIASTIRPTDVMVLQITGIKINPIAYMGKLDGGDTVLVYERVKPSAELQERVNRLHLAFKML